MSRKGVYKILNIATEEFYVGSTSVSFRKRLGHHVMTLTKGTNANKHLQKSWNRFGESMFLFKIICPVEGGMKEVREKEQEILDKTAGVSGRLNIESFSRKDKTYIATSPDGKEFLVTHLPSFCKLHGLYDVKMRDCARGISISHKDWQCRFKGAPPTAIDRTAKIRKSYILTTPDGIEFESSNLPQVCKDHGLGWAGQIGLGKVPRGQVSNYKGWLCRFADGSSPEFKNGNDKKRRSYVITSPSGEVFHVNNLPGFCQEHELGRRGEIGLGKVARGQQKTPYKGWLCRFAD